MDPCSHAKGAFSTFKDVYLVSKFIYKTVKGVQQKDADWSELESKFSLKLLLLAILGVLSSSIAST